MTCMNPGREGSFNNLHMRLTPVRPQVVLLPSSAIVQTEQCRGVRAVDVPLVPPWTIIRRTFRNNIICDAPRVVFCYKLSNGCLKSLEHYLGKNSSTSLR